MRRMIGNIGHDEDIRHLFSAEDRGRLSPALDPWDFRAARVHAPRLVEEARALPDGAVAEQRIRAWIEDGCPKARGDAYAAFFDELDAWTEYWDIDHPESRGRYYFGDGEGNPGYLSAFMPSPERYRTPVFERWKDFATFHHGPAGAGARRALEAELTAPAVREALVEVDVLVSGLLRRHFGGPDGAIDVLKYLDAVERFGVDTLPEDPGRQARVPAGDIRKKSALHHTMDSDIMWFCWATHVECTVLVLGSADPRRAEHALLAAGIALGCSMDYAFRGRRRTRSEYQADEATAELIRTRALAWSRDFDAVAAELRDLFRIREYGEP